MRAKETCMKNQKRKRKETQVTLTRQEAIYREQVKIANSKEHRKKKEDICPKTSPNVSYQAYFSAREGDLYEIEQRKRTSKNKKT